MSERTILIAEKVHATRQRIKNFLESYEYKVVEVDSYGELEFTVRNRIVDLGLILVDYDILDDDGAIAAHTLSRITQGKPLVMMTSQTSKTIIVEALEQGVSDIVTKPVDEILLIKKMQKLMSTVVVDARLCNNVTLDIPTLVEKECTKAKKGQYEVTFMMTKLLTHHELSGHHMTKGLEESFFKSLESRFWGTDYLLKQQDLCFLGIFPFCSHENTHILDRKVEAAIDHNKINTSGIRSVTAFITYPNAAREFENVEHIITDLNSMINIKMRNGIA